MLSFVIVSYNSENHIESCINHISMVEDIVYEIIVVDNDSKDNTKQIVKDKFPEVKLIESHENRGFSWGVNIGVSHAKYDYVFILNPDSMVQTRQFKESLHELSLNGVGIIGPKVINPGDKARQYSARRFPTLRTGVFNRSSIFTSLIPNNRHSREYLDPIENPEETQKVDWVSGCAILFKKGIYHEVDGFDESFFVFYEDIDFCKRVTASGHSIQYYPDIQVEHEIGISKTVPTIKINYERHRGMWVYYKKHFERNFILDIIVLAGIISRFMITSIKVVIKTLKRKKKLFL
ncbi:MAG: glycosyltransferase family 2 protein [Deltaproteobacteria bacterium]|nr:glycosyltransferase family 2 protein [Candidatus Zymogenaceae bacterium]